LVIDNNFDRWLSGYDHLVEAERVWIGDWCSKDRHSHLEKIKFPKKNHGLAIDHAVNWCREHKIRWMLHFEPDCLIDGVEWANKLLEATKQDIWMAGSHRKSYGPIHPTPSIWDVNQVKHSFMEQLRRDDVNHPRFHEVMNMKNLMDQITDQERNYWSNYWDTAQKPWFDCAIHDKAVLVEATPDFRHFWMGSTSNTDPNQVGDDRVKQYL
jgi:hypothetical protein